MASSEHDDAVIQRLKRLHTAKRLAHAYLFTGPSGSGTMAAALKAAQLVNCSLQMEAPCGQCPSCTKIANSNHPDVYWIGNNEELSIKIDEIRQMLGRVALRPFEAEVKVFIIKNAERMTTEAANALLKTLEEPAPHTLIILITAVPEACLDTIKSRCHTCKFFIVQEPLPEEQEDVLNAFLSRNPQEDYMKALSADSRALGRAMLVMLSWVRDVLLYKNGVGMEHLLHHSRADQLKAMAARDINDLSALNRQIVRVKALADDNLNVKMALGLLRERVWAN